MNLIQKIHMLHSAWHYRLNTEKEDIRFLLGLDLSGQTLVDIGANKGIYAYWMSRKAGPQGRVIAFEPQPELKRHLKELKQSFRLDNLEIINKALSSEPGRTTLYRPEPGSGAASLGSRPTEWETVDVEMATLDDYCDDFSNVGFIKCDVEGHELAVFKGGLNMLQRDMPCLLFECHHDAALEQDLFLFLESIGYEGFFAHGRYCLIHCSRFEEYPYRRKIERHRNYIFMNRSFLNSLALARYTIVEKAK